MLHLANLRNSFVLAIFVFLAGALIMAVLLPALAAGESVTTRVSVSAIGEQADGDSNYVSLSDSGRFIAFSSTAANLVAGDTNAKRDVFVHDRQSGVIERISISADGTQGDKDSNTPAISSDGRYVAFLSDATNLVADDTNDKRDIFVHDRQTGTTERVSVASDGAQADNSSSYLPDISADGRYVAFLSDAANLVADDTNLTMDAFVHDRQTGVTERVSVSSSGTQADQGGMSTTVSITNDGRYVAFTSYATNLLDEETSTLNKAFVRDRTTNVTTLVSVSTGGIPGSNHTTDVSIAGDGRFVTFDSLANNLAQHPDTNGVHDVFIRDMQAGTTEFVSISSDGVLGNSSSGNPSISADGSIVTFSSMASNLVAADTNNVVDIFVHNLTTGSTERVSISSGGAQGDGDSYLSSVSADGSIVAFESIASNLVADDTNSLFDIFVYSPQPDEPEPTPTPTQEPAPTPTPTQVPQPTPKPEPQPHIFLPVVVR